MINSKNFCQWFESNQVSLKINNQRRLLVLEGEFDWFSSLVNTTIKCLNNQKEQSYLLWGDLLAEHEQLHEKFNISNYRHHLGTENALVVFADSNFHPDAFAALSGTLVAGGFFFYYRPVSSRADDFFKQRINNSVLIDQDVLIVKQSDQSLPALINAQPIKALQASAPLPFACKTPEQENAVTAVLKVAQGKRKRPLVLTADRGRGKSSALAIAVAQLLQQTNIKLSIAITAGHQDASKVFFQQLARSCAQGEYQQGQFCYQDHVVKFLPVDVLIKQPQTLSLLLVDEAAAIPVHLLTKLTSLYHRIVFSSTVHGYEGAGRGFAIKFLTQLALTCPQYQQLHLKQPIRWAENDPLERFVFNTFLLNVEKRNDKNVAIVDDNIDHSVISQQQLAENECLLHEVFAVLITAHYQTSPSDLKLLLSNENVRLLISKSDEKVVAVALCLVEGQAQHSDITKLSQSKARLKNQFLPQSLFLHNGIEQAFDYRYLRIMRIAVYPSYQQQGLGSKLLNYVLNYAQQQAFDTVGSSFAANRQLLSFWFKAGFKLTRIGFSCDQASGEHSAAVFYPLTERANEMLHDCHLQFYRSFSYLLTEQYRNLDSELVYLTISYWPKEVLPELSAFDLKTLDDFLSKKRLYDTCVYNLHRYLIYTLATNKLNHSDAPCLIAKVLQKQDLQSLCHNYHFTGKKALQVFLVEAFARLRANTKAEI